MMIHRNITINLINLIEELQTKANTTKPSNQSVVQSYNQSCIIIAKTC